MKISISIILFFSIFLFTNFNKSKTYEKPSFTYKTYGNFVNYFENETDLLTFFDFHKHEFIAEIGTNDGKNIFGLSLLIDSVTFFSQDIFAKNINKAFNKYLNSSKNTTTGNVFNVIIGTEKTTNLPNNTFDKIFLSNTFHEFTFMDEMLSDIYNKLKPNGKLYILECKCLKKSHLNYSFDQTNTILKKNKFKLIKHDGKDLNGSEGLYRVVFSKDL